MTSTRKPSGSPRPNRATARRRQRQRRQAPVVAVVVGVVVVLAVIAFVATRGGSGDGSGVATSGGTGVAQVRPVSVTGQPLAVLPDGGKDPAVGQVIPDVSGQSFDGTPVRIGNDGRAKLLFIVAHWCPHCQKEVPLVTSWLKDKTLPARTDVVAISTAVNRANGNYPPSAWLSREKWPVPTLADDSRGTAASAFGLSGYPFIVAVDASGKVVDRTSGEQPASVLDRMLAEATGASTAG